jgi:3-hydroxybutyrate dehydrogenase
MTERYLENQHAIVTGGGRGIGAAIAIALAHRGARLTILGRSTAALEAHAALLRREHDADVRAITCDVTESAALPSAFRRATAELGPVDVLVNNAGAAESAKFAEITREHWDEMLAVNLTATFACTQLVIPSMITRRTGRVINIASTAGLRGFKNMTAYCAAKHGVVGLTRALAMEVAKHGVTVNAICPGWTDTAMAEQAVANIVRVLDKTPDEARAVLVGQIPRGKLTSPEEVASAVSWLCAPESAAVTGIVLPVAGGEIQ